MSALLVADLPVPDIDLHVVMVAHRHQVLQVGREGLQKHRYKLLSTYMYKKTTGMLTDDLKFILVCKLIVAF